MKISSKGRYGLRAMLDLAMQEQTDIVPLKSIAERQNISENYLLQVFATLRKAGLVKSVKGAQGGYMLADSPGKISVGMILRALEGDLSVIHEQTEDLSETQSFEHCLQSNVWEKIDAAINAVVDAVTLEDLCLDYKKHYVSEAPMFYI